MIERRDGERIERIAPITTTLREAGGEKSELLRQQELEARFRLFTRYFGDNLIRMYSVLIIF